MTRGPDKQFDRDEALNEAMQLFWSHGYEATGVADLLSHMGIGRQSLYDTFGSKRTLFLEALRTYFIEQAKTAESLLGGSGTAIENLEAFLENREQLVADLPKGCLIGNTAAELGPHDPEVAQTVRAFLGEFKKSIADLLRAGQEAGDIRRDLDPVEMASVVVVTFQGAALLSKVESDLSTTRSAFRGLLEFLKPA